MKYNFDKIVSRKNTNSVKWGFKGDLQGHEDCLPMWIADMDFETVPEIKEAIIKRAEHAIYGYAYKPESYNQAIINWMKKKHNWDIEESWINISPGIVPAFNFIMRAFTHPGDKVIVQTPGYSPFVNAILRNGVQVVNNPLKLINNKYKIDFEDLKMKITDKRVKMLMLCNPHNPVGRVWTKEELTEIGNICLKNNVLVLSDEIHSDLIYKGYKHTPFASINKEFQQISITCTAPSKTFNLAGLQSSNIIIPNENLRNIFNISLENIGISRLNIFGMVACEAAYNYGESWLEQLMEYIEGNKDYAIRFIKEKIPSLKVVEPEGTYLLWIDCNQLAMTEEKLNRFMLEKAKVIVDRGHMFGKGGEGFVRVNLACPRELIIMALNRLEVAINYTKS